MSGQNGRPPAQPGHPRVLLDVSHPAHVQLIRPIAGRLLERGAEVLVAGRVKDVTVELLEDAALPFFIASRAAGNRTRLTDAIELLQRVRSIRRSVRRWKPSVILTRNPSGVLAGLGRPVQTIFDTDDGRAVGLHYLLAAPFANIVTSSVHDPEVHGTRHFRYSALKVHAWLHPNTFRTDPSVRARYGIAPDRPLMVARWSRHDSSHDAGARRITPEARHRVLGLLRQHGAVLESAEGTEPRLHDGGMSRPVAPVDFTQLLATASCCVTDGQSVAAEAAVLGVPALRLSSFPEPIWYLELLERRGLVQNFRPDEGGPMISALESLLDGLPEVRREAARRAALMNETAIDLATWFADHIIEVSIKPREDAAARS